MQGTSKNHILSVIVVVNLSYFCILKLNKKDYKGLLAVEVQVNQFIVKSYSCIMRVDVVYGCRVLCVCVLCVLSVVCVWMVCMRGCM